MIDAEITQIKLLKSEIDRLIDCAAFHETNLARMVVAQLILDYDDCYWSTQNDKYYYRKGNLDVRIEKGACNINGYDYLSRWTKDLYEYLSNRREANYRKYALEREFKFKPTYIP